MNTLTKLIIAVAISLGSVLSAQAQEKTWEHSIYVSAGPLIITDIEDSFCGHGLTIKAGYGINHYFSEYLSVMSGLAWHKDMEDLFSPKDGGSSDWFEFLDIPVIFQAHLNDDVEGNKWMLGIGPVFSRCIQNDKYDFDDGLYHQSTGLNKIKDFNFSIMPMVAYETKHLRIGIDGNIGLRNVKLTHGEFSGKKHLHNICASFGVKF